MKTPLKELITDGAYDSMLTRLQANNNPNLHLLVYDKNFTVNDFLVIPKHFFLPEIIVKRPELNPTARRAGWVGCNINISAIGDAGKVFYVKNKSIIRPEFVVQNYNKTFFLRESALDQKRWIMEIIKIVNIMPQNEFSLKDIYAYVDELQLLFPENMHIKEKIRQQLQILRDKGYISFVGRGLYRKL